MNMIFIEILQLNCYAVPELPRPGIPYITVTVQPETNMHTCTSRSLVQLVLSKIQIFKTVLIIFPRRKEVR